MQKDTKIESQRDRKIQRLIGREKERTKKYRKKQTYINNQKTKKESHKNKDEHRKQ